MRKLICILSLFISTFSLAESANSMDRYSFFFQSAEECTSMISSDYVLPYDQVLSAIKKVSKNKRLFFFTCSKQAEEYLRLQLDSFDLDAIPIVKRGVFINRMFLNEFLQPELDSLKALSELGTRFYNVSYSIQEAALSHSINNNNEKHSFLYYLDKAKKENEYLLGVVIKMKREKDASQYFYEEYVKSVERKISYVVGAASAEDSKYDAELIVDSFNNFFEKLAPANKFSPKVVNYYLGEHFYNYINERIEGSQQCDELLFGPAFYLSNRYLHKIYISLMSAFKNKERKNNSCAIKIYEYLSYYFPSVNSNDFVELRKAYESNNMR